MEQRIYALLIGTRRDHTVVSVLVDHPVWLEDPVPEHHFTMGTTERRHVGLVTVEAPQSVMADLGSFYEEQ